MYVLLAHELPCLRKNYGCLVWKSNYNLLRSRLKWPGQNHLCMWFVSFIIWPFVLSHYNVWVQQSDTSKTTVLPPSLTNTGKNVNHLCWLSLFTELICGFIQIKQSSATHRCYGSSAISDTHILAEFDTPEAFALKSCKAFDSSQVKN